jgi:hypothetical protein
MNANERRLGNILSMPSRVVHGSLRRSHLRRSAFICGFILAGSIARADTVLLADGESLTGTVRAGGQPGTVLLEPERGGLESVRSLALNDLVGIDFGRPPALETITVVLKSGERLAGAVSFPQPDRVAVARSSASLSVARSGGSLSVPLALCASLRFSASPPAAGAGDVILLANGDRITGKFFGVRDGKATIRPGGAGAAKAPPLSVPLKRIAAVTFRQTPDERARPATGPRSGGRQTTDRSGTRVLVELDTGEQFAGVWDGGAGEPAAGEKAADDEPQAGDEASPAKELQRIQLRSDWAGNLSLPMASVGRILVQNGRCVFVSDLRPVEARQTPYLDGAHPYRVNQSQAGGPLQIGGTRFGRGLGVRSRSDLTYELAAGYKAFAAVIGVDAAAGGAGSVIFRVLGDDKVLYESPVVRGGDEPRAVRVDVSGVLLLRLVVDFADNGDIGDYADWGNARLLR